MVHARTAVVLDAMGVIYATGDDVAELLVPYVASHGGADSATVEAAYMRASRGELTAGEFWVAVGLHERHEDAYLAKHELAAGLVPFLEWAARRGHGLACLSNDVSDWSLKLRRRFGLDRYIPEWVISGDVKSRKPERAIYEALFARLDRPPAAMLFVDDRTKNLDAARRLGMQTVLLNPGASHGGHAQVRTLAELADFLEANAE
jgi:HAD superfamily hydrolase (TIGR01509 family)